MQVFPHIGCIERKKTPHGRSHPEFFRLRNVDFCFVGYFQALTASAFFLEARTFGFLTAARIFAAARADRNVFGRTRSACIKRALIGTAPDFRCFQRLSRLCVPYFGRSPLFKRLAAGLILCRCVVSVDANRIFPASISAVIGAGCHCALKVGHLFRLPFCFANRLICSRFSITGFLFGMQRFFLCQICQKCSSQFSRFLYDRLFPEFVFLPFIAKSKQVVHSRGKLDSICFWSIVQCFSVFHVESACFLPKTGVY